MDTRSSKENILNRLKRAPRTAYQGDEPVYRPWGSDSAISMDDKSRTLYRHDDRQSYRC